MIRCNLDGGIPTLCSSASTSRDRVFTSLAPWGSILLFIGVPSKRVTKGAGRFVAFAPAQARIVGVGAQISALAWKPVAEVRAIRGFLPFHLWCHVRITAVAPA
jgi:hypothetical protein